MQAHPELYASILWYFQQYKRLPRKVGDFLVRELKSQPLYGAITVELIQTADGRLSPTQTREVDNFVRANWKPRSFPADLLATLGRWGIERDVLTINQVEYAVGNLQEWWARAELVATLGSGKISKPALKALLNAKLVDNVSDVAKAAAVSLVEQNLEVTARRSHVQHSAAHVLEAFGLLPTGSAKVCGIEVNMHRMLGRAVAAVDWQNVFGAHYAQVERQALLCRALAETDITAWVNAMDVFNDWLMIALFNHDPGLGTYMAGSFGSVISNKKMKAKYPALHAMVTDIHHKRGESSLSHAWTRKGSTLVKPTGPIRYSYLRAAKKLIAAALAEIAAKW